MESVPGSATDEPFFDGFDTFRFSLTTDDRSLITPSVNLFKTSSPVAGRSSCGARPGADRGSACLTAAQTEMASISGGSPTALLTADVLGVVRVVEELDVEVGRHVGDVRDLVRRRRVGQQSPIGGRKVRASVVTQPMPCTNPPMTWPRSIAGLIDRPISISRSTRLHLHLAVKRSISTSATAAPLV